MLRMQSTVSVEKRHALKSVSFYIRNNSFIAGRIKYFTEECSGNNNSTQFLLLLTQVPITRLSSATHCTNLFCTIQGASKIRFL